MTLILTCLTETAVFQVSDRRLTQFGAPQNVLDDETNKSIFVDGRMCFGYTGVSQIGTEKTDDWFVRVATTASTHDMAALAESIRGEATRAFAASPAPPRFKFHAFQGAGWLRLPSQEHFQAAFITIHNGIDFQTGGWLATPMDAFQTQCFRARLRGGIDIASVGTYITPDERSLICRMMTKPVRHKRATALAVPETLVRVVRWLADRHNTIGKSLMAACIPHAAVLNAQQTGRMMVLLGPPMPEQPTFAYVSGSGGAIHFGPHVVSGETGLTNVSVTRN